LSTSPGGTTGTADAASTCARISRTRSGSASAAGVAVVAAHAAAIDAASPIAKFLERNPDGGMHHICYEVDDILAARDKLKAEGARVLGDGEPKTGAHGKPVLFLHPKDFNGTLIELEQV
jgi:methylmalonyl-CoA epimerase